MREINGSQMYDLKDNEVVVFKTPRGYYSALKHRNDLSGTRKIVKFLSGKVFGFIQKHVVDFTLYIGELEQVNVILDSDDDILWYEDQEYSLSDRATRFVPGTTDEVIHKWVQSEGLKVYRVV